MHEGNVLVIFWEEALYGENLSGGNCCRGKCPGGCPGELSEVRVPSRMQDYKYLRIAVMIGTTLVDTHWWLGGVMVRTLNL